MDVNIIEDKDYGNMTLLQERINKPNRGHDALGTRGRDARDTRQSQSPAFGGKPAARIAKPVPFDRLRAGSEQRRRIRNKTTLLRDLRALCG
ncbi:MAG: hypothetical protein ACYSWQ_06340 [Planctomycetota bacterium]